MSDIEYKGKAYNPEDQGMLIKRLQDSDQLMEIQFIYGFHRFVNDQGLNWVIISEKFSFSGTGSATLLVDNCNVDLLAEIKKGAIVTKIVPTDYSQLLTEDGSFIPPIAALLHDGKPIYRSPGFDLEKYNSSKAV